jgi:hypothetical protein
MPGMTRGLRKSQRPNGSSVGFGKFVVVVGTNTVVFSVVNGVVRVVSAFVSVSVSGTTDCIVVLNVAVSVVAMVVLVCTVAGAAPTVEVRVLVHVLVEVTRPAICRHAFCTDFSQNPRRGSGKFKRLRFCRRSARLSVVSLRGVSNNKRIY